MDDLIRMNPPTISKARRWAALAAAIVVWKLIPRDMDIAEGGH